VCGTTIKDKRECEHKLSILFAILITGLYDRRLHRVLIDKGLDAQYIALLKPEYAWAHQLCNQVKSDIPLVQLAFEGRGVKTVQAVPSDSNTKTMLKGILESTGKYEPTPAELWAKLTTEDNQWNGQVAEGDRIGRWTGTQETWIQSRIDSIVGAMNETVKNFNFKRYTTDVLIASFVNSLWRRACFLAPEAVKSLRYDTLPPVYQRMVDDAFAARNGAGRRRTRRRQRGGDRDEGEVWVYLAESLAKAIRLPRLRELILTRYRACESLPDSWMECVCEALSEYAKECETLAANALSALETHRIQDSRTPSVLVDEVSAQLIHALNPGWEEENLAVRTADAGVPPVSSWASPAPSNAAAMEDEGEKTPPPKSYPSKGLLSPGAQSPRSEPPSTASRGQSDASSVPEEPPATLTQSSAVELPGGFSFGRRPKWL
jgi:hypothetical protein